MSHSVHVLCKCECFTDLFLIVFGPQWSSVAQREKLQQALATQMIPVNSID